MFRFKSMRRRAVRSQLLWFLLLWAGGVSGAALLALPFHFLVMAAQH